MDRMRTPRRARWLFSAAAGVMLVLLGTASASGATMLLKVGYPQPSGAQLPLWIIPEAGLDAAYGLKVQPIFILGGARLVQAMVAGDAPVATTGGAIVQAALSGADAHYIATVVQTYGFSIYVRPDQVKEVADLKWKVLGVMTKGASSDHAAVAVLRHHGLKAGSDVKLLYLGGVREVLAALDRGVIPAGVVSSPTTLFARRQGYKELVNIATFNFPYVHSGVGTSRAFVRSHPEVITSFLKAFLSGLKVIREQPELAKRATARYLKTQDPEILEESYRAFLPLFPRMPYVSAAAIRSLLSVADHPRAKSADPEEFFDNSHLKALEDSGFIRELERKRG
ncbi:MAG: ABC transporter substrate-binding protein [Deltaproteobacteria bacterium]|nr:ABC transporter substrate-binding protein [Deltaproteobacteria bacterium]